MEIPARGRKARVAAPVQREQPSVEPNGTRAHDPTRLARNVSLLGVGQVLTWTLTLAWTLIVPRLIGPSGMGLIVMATAASGILVGLAGLGSRPLLVKEIAANHDRAPELLGTAFAVRAALILPCVGLVALYVHVTGFRGEQAVALYLGAGLAAFTLLAEVCQAGLQGVERMQYLAMGDVVNKGLQSVLNIPMAIVGLAATWLIAAQVVAAATAMGLYLLWTRGFRIDWRVRLRRVRDFVSGSLAYWAYALFFTFYLWIDATMLSLLAPQQVVGWYGVPTRIFQTLMFVPVILSTAWLPRLAAAYTRGPRQLRDAARMPLELTMVLSLPIAVGTALVAWPLITIVYGPAYQPSVPVLEVLAITCVPMYLNIMINQVLTAANRQAVWTKAMIVASVINPLLNLALIRITQQYRGNGALGAALSMFLTEIVIVAMGVWIIRRFLDLPSMLRRVARAVPATVGMAGVAWPLSHFGLVQEVAGGAVTFAVLSVGLRVLSREEVGELRRMAGAVGNRVRGRRRQQPEAPIGVAEGGGSRPAEVLPARLPWEEWER
jgi:O-antigen/teichoic acid export membrane protein